MSENEVLKAAVVEQFNKNAQDENVSLFHLYHYETVDGCAVGPDAFVQQHARTIDP